MMQKVIFDIETGRQSKEAIERIAPIFKESSVKTGNLGLDKALERSSRPGKTTWQPLKKRVP